MLWFAKACCELKPLEGMLNVIEEAARVVIDGASLADECMRPGFIGQP
jgi:hypothetical protein